MRKRRSYFAQSPTETTPFAGFVARHGHDLLVFFVRRTYDVEAASDMAAETFAQAWEHRGKFRGATEDEAIAWLYGIARHQLSRYARRGRVHRKAVDRLGIHVPDVADDDYQRIVDLAGLTDLRQGIEAAFESLSAGQREMLRLRIVEERPYPEIATALGLSEQAVRARVSRALGALAQALEMKQRAEATL